MRRLRQDHVGLSRVLRTIDSLLDRLTREPETVLPILVDAFGYLLGYQHAFHHPREDRLFARIQRKRPALQDTLARLGHEHESGEREAARLAKDLTAVTAQDLSGSAGDDFVRRIREYVVAARVHMRDEEAVFYVRAETALSASDWSSILSHDDARDPLTDLAELARAYPELAAYLDQPVRHLGQADTETSGGNAWHRPLLALTDLYGGLLHEGVDLTRRNLGRLLAVRGPIGLVGAVGAISTDNLRFAGRCVTRPSRWAIDTASGWLSARPRSGAEDG
ncbi:MAG: hypothetical protein GVY11_06785 [Gammaproteobacteria bacterium]|jgi:hemerythrin-like domain-containing protein|nr:hypothetical protein [Gammaproteobacteria bacterium]